MKTITHEELRHIQVEYTLNPVTSKLLNHSGQKVTKAFVEDSSLFERTLEAINTLKGDEELLQTAIGRLANKLPNYLRNEKIAYNIEKGKATLAFNLLYAMIDMGIVESTTELGKVLNEETGKMEFKSSTYLNFKQKYSAKDLFKGISTKPSRKGHISSKAGSRKLKLNSMQKEYTQAINSRRLRLVRTPKAVLKEFYMTCNPYVKAVELSKKSNRAESPLQAELRMESYMEAVLKLQEEEVLYLETWYDSRLRTYYSTTLLGINPHGSSFETYQWELADAKVITEAGSYKLIKSIVGIVEDERISTGRAVEMFDYSYVERLRKLEGKLSDTFYNGRLADAYDDYLLGNPSHFLLSEDATNGGLQNGGVGFRNSKCMTLANVGGDSIYHDSHADMVDAFALKEEDLDPELMSKAREDFNVKSIRDLIKKAVNTPLLHGSTAQTISDSLKAIAGVEMPKEEVTERIVKAYGTLFHNINTLATAGGDLITNENTSLMYNTIDGWKAQSSAYTKSTPLKLYAIRLDNSVKSGVSTTKVLRDMPIFLSRKREVVFQGTKDKRGNDLDKVTVKKRGLYANITHSTDGFLLREVGRKFIQNGNHILFKHDNFLCHPNDMVDVEDAYRGGLVKSFNYRPYHKALKDISKTNKEATKLIDVLIDGDATVDMIENSHNFLAV